MAVKSLALKCDNDNGGQCDKYRNEGVRSANAPGDSIKERQTGSSVMLGYDALFYNV